MDSVKNFWPGGDSYAGINVAMVTPSGMPWEIQFHTAASFEVKQATHVPYERMREKDTSPAERRRLFDEMTRTWATVPVPAGILEPGSVHPSMKLRTFERP